jgi:hypothetical protein
MHAGFDAAALQVLQSQSDLLDFNYWQHFDVLL